MIILVTGGSGSGKSIIAEKICTSLNIFPMYYIATMKVYDDECSRRIERHRRQRNGKGFITVEAPEQIDKYIRFIEKNGSALLECMGNLIANEQFEVKPENVIETVINEITELNRHLKALVIVTNEVCCDVVPEESETAEYLRNIGSANCRLADLSDIVIEAVSGYPVLWKGSDLYNKILNQ